MFYTLLNYIQLNFTDILPSHSIVKESKNSSQNTFENTFENNGNLVWSTNGSTTVYTDVESGLAKYDFFDVFIKSQ